MNDRAVGLFDNYEIEVSRTWKGRGAILCESDRGLLILKEYNGPMNKIFFQDMLLKHIKEAGFPLSESILRTKENELIVYDQDRVPYIVKSYFEGKECNNRELEECCQAVHVLARLHNCADLSKWENLASQPVFHIEKEYEKHNKELKKVRRFLREKSQKTAFEIYLIEHYDSFFDYALQVTEEMRCYMKERKNVNLEEFPIVCHGDYQLRNFSEREAETELWDYAKSDPKHMRILQKVSHEIMNVLEDGYIEQRMLMDYPGVLGSGLQAMRDGDFESMPTVSQIIENEPEQGHIWLTILQVISYYMEWGEIKYGDTPLTDTRIQTVFSMLPELDLALTSRDYKDRCRTANLILIRCWTHIRDFMDLCEKQAAAAGVDAADFARQLMEALAGSSAEATGETTPVVVSASTPGNGGPTAKGRAETAKLAGKDAEEDKSEGDAEKEAAADAGEPSADNEGSEKSGEPSGDGLTQPDTCRPISETKGGCIPLQEDSPQNLLLFSGMQ